MTHSFDIKDAEKYGVSEAIILYNIRYWIATNRANRENLHDGRVWTYNSARAFSELFPYFTADKIRRYLDNLEADGALITGNYNKRPGDRTKWYSIPGADGEAPRDAAEIDQKAAANPPDHLANSPEQLANPPHPFGKSAAPLPDINPDLNQIENTHTARADNPIEFKPGGVPPRISEQFERYRKHVRDCGPIGRFLLNISGALAMVGEEILHDALAQVNHEATRQGFDTRYSPGMAALLSDEHKLRDRAAKYAPPQKAVSAEPDYEAQTMQELENMTDAERAARFAWYAQTGLIAPQEAVKKWKHLMPNLTQSQAS